MANKETFEMYRGEDRTETWSMNPAEDITGWTLAFTLRRKSSESILLTKALTITNAALGLATFTIASADTIGLDFGKYVYDIQRTNTGFRTVLTIGTFNLLPEVGV